DKEHVLNGKLAIQRIVCDQPIIHLIRGQDGDWNMEGVLAPPTPEIAIPTIKLEHATVLLEDNRACPNASALEINDVNLVIINDPHRPPAVSQLTFNGKGVADLAETVQVKGTLSRLTKEFTASIQVPRF